MTTLKCVNMSHSQRYDNLTEIQKMYPKIAKVNYTQNYGMYYIKHCFSKLQTIWRESVL